MPAASIVTVALVILVRRWPFTEENLAQSLQEDFSGTAKITKFQRVYFPRPGCVAEGIVFNRSDSPQGTPPFFRIHKFILAANYPDLLFRKGYISRVTLEGLHVSFPPRGTSGRTIAGVQEKSNQNWRTRRRWRSRRFRSPRHARAVAL